MLWKTFAHTAKPPVGARVDLTHPLGRACQAVCLFNDGAGTPRVASGGPVNTFLDSPSVQFYQALGNRQPLVYAGAGTNASWTINTAGKALLFPDTNAAFSLTYHSVAALDLDFPEHAINGVVSRGQTVLLIRRKTDTTLRASTLFGVEVGLTLPNSARCGAHVPYSDGTVYWDYGEASGANRLTVAGLSFSTSVEKWAFTAGPRGSTIWRDGVKLASQTTALTRTVPARVSDLGGWMLNRGNGNVLGDLQEVSFAMYLGTQWIDDQVAWWFSDPYAAFYTPWPQRRYVFLGYSAATSDQFAWRPIYPSQFLRSRKTVPYGDIPGQVP